MKFAQKLVIFFFVTTVFCGMVKQVFAQTASSSASSDLNIEQLPQATSSSQVAPLSEDTNLNAIMQLLKPLPFPTLTQSDVNDGRTDATAEAPLIDQNVLTPSPSVSQIGLSARMRSKPKLHQLRKRSYPANEKIEVVVDNPDATKVDMEIKNSQDESIPAQVEEVSDGAQKIYRLSPPPQFKPGKYTLTMTDWTGEVSKQDFTWGVLAINTNKSIYKPDEDVDFSMAVLDESGSMVCNANVLLTIQPPSGGLVTLSTDSGTIIVNNDCFLHQKTTRPDYEAHYKAQGVGNYNLHLKAQTKNGTYEIDDNFLVQDNPLFDVERITATRIYPASSYEVRMKIQANTDFEGQVVETVPGSFKITPSESKEVVAYKKIDDESLIQDNQSTFNPAETSIGRPLAEVYPLSLTFGQQEENSKEQTNVKKSDGIEFQVPAGTDVLAVDDGKISSIDSTSDYGTVIQVEHTWGTTYYGYLEKVDVQKGDQVTKGKVIAATGIKESDKTELFYFAVKPNETDEMNGFSSKVDPITYIKINTDGTFIDSIDKTEMQVHRLIWDLRLKKGQNIEIGYVYQAPQISPQFYTLGPLSFTNKSNQNVFSENRKWQIAADALSMTDLTNSVTTTNANSYTTASITPTANHLILAWIMNSDTTNPATPTLAGNGLTWVQITTVSSQVVSGQYKRVTVFRAMGASPTSGTITITASSSTGAGWDIQDWSGIDTSGTNGSGAIGVSNTNSASAATSLTVTLSSFNAKLNATAMAIATSANARVTQENGYTEVSDAGYSSPTTDFATEYLLSADTTPSFTFASAGVVGAAVEINQATTSINIGGAVKQADKSTFVGNPPCNGSTAVVSLRINGGAASNTTCANSTGAYTFSSVSVRPGQTITIYLNSSSTPKANLVMLIGSSTLSDVDLYQNWVITRNETTATLDTDDLGRWDNDDDSTNMLYTSNTASTYATESGIGWHNWTGDTFNVLVDSSVGGSYENQGTITWSPKGVVFNSTSTGNYLKGTMTGTSSLYKVEFNGSGGEWTIQDAIRTTENSANNFKVTAGTVTLGNGGGDNLEADGTFSVASGATFQTMSGLAQGDNTACNSDDICIDINANSSPPSCANCVISVSGIFTINKNATVRFNSNASVESGITVNSGGTATIQGTQDDTGTDTGTDSDSLRETLICANKSWTTNSERYKKLRMTSGFARGRLYDITASAASDGNCLTNSDDSLTRANTSTTDTTIATISGSGNSRTVCAALTTTISANNEGVGRYLRDMTHAGYYLIVKSTNADATCGSSRDSFVVMPDPISPDAIGNLAASDSIDISDGVKTGDTFEILDYATVTANATNNGYYYAPSGASSTIKYAEISELGTESAPYYGIDFDSSNPANAGEKVLVQDNYIHDMHRCIRLASTSNVNQYYSSGVIDNTIQNCVFAGIDSNFSVNAEINGNRVDTIASTGNGIMAYASDRYMWKDNIVSNATSRGFDAELGSGGFVVQNNRSFLNSTYGIYIDSSDKGVYTGNLVFANTTAGIYSQGTVNTLEFAGNTADQNPINFEVNSSTALTTYAYGESYGNYVGATSEDVLYAGTGAHKSIFSNSIFGSTTETSGITVTNDYLISLKHDQTSGLTRVWNDYVIPSDITETPNTESTNKFNYSNNLWEDSVMPHLYVGTATEDTNLNFAFNGGSLGGSSNYYVYKAMCAASTCSTSPTGTWQVIRDGSYVSTATSGTTFTDGTTNVQFKIDGTHNRGDSYSFIAFKNSNDTSVQKSVTMMQTGDTFSVNSSTTLQLLGSSSSTPTLFQKDAGATNYSFTLGGGTLNANQYSVSGTGNTGINLSSGTVSDFSNGKFDNTGGTVGLNSTYVTVTSGILNAGAQTWTGMVFDEASGTDSNIKYNVTLSGTPSACSNAWTFESTGRIGGTSAGETNDLDGGDGGGCNSGNGYLLWTSPAVGGPTLDQLLRHGDWFNSSGVRQSFTY